MNVYQKNRVRLGRDAMEAARLARQVQHGEKWATSYPLGTIPMPFPGQEFVIDGGDEMEGVPVRIRAVGVLRMDAIGPDFAAAEGHPNIEDWRRVHREFYRSMGTIDPNPMVVQIWIERRQAKCP